MEMLGGCLDPFQFCMAAPQEITLEQHQSPTERTPLLSPHDLSEVTASSMQREVKALTVLLLDGERDMFNLDAVTKGFEGGMEMASLLQAKMLDYLATRDDLAYTHDLICYMMLNPWGRLATMLKACGKQESLNKFIEGFNSSPHLFFIVQCANAECKLLDLLNHYSLVPTCDSILFGGLHLASRASALRTLDPSASKKVTLVQTISRASVYDMLDIPITYSLETLFGDLKLDSRDEGAQNGAEQGGEEARSETPSTLEWKEPKSSKKEKKKTKAIKGMLVPSSVRLSEDLEADSSMPSGGGDSQTNGLTPKSSTSRRKKAQDSSSPEIYVAPNRRFDSPASLQTNYVPTINFSWPHPCNEFYLSPNGCRHGDCPYSHDYKFNPQEWRDYPAVIKSKVCRNVKAGGGAESCKFGDSCLYGHACPFTWDACPYVERCFFAQAGLPHADGRVE
ncbi:hypothetical protein BCR35DRAFT_350501 [Leucosporidium creatinivorum]|uniref:C3H1-type domain-containing protein n=1 Tax=Leucosporidium creatinivorum TaxID=106004 RepID=A0A1Y2FZK2_9BASI|nr:hypothetical protein BCR35DRAFT_350501 [Leucosporidium creatinivorum]